MKIYTFINFLKLSTAETLVFKWKNKKTFVCMNILQRSLE